MIHKLIQLIPNSYQLISCKLCKEPINELNPQTLSQRKKYLCPPDEIQEAYQCISSFSSITTTCFAAISLLTTFIFAITVCCIHTQTVDYFLSKKEVKLNGESGNSLRGELEKSPFWWRYGAEERNSAMKRASVCVCDLWRKEKRREFCMKRGNGQLL